MEQKYKYVTLEKLSDDIFNGLHPNGIYEGAKRDGILMNEVVVGDAVILGHELFKAVYPTFHTSVVTEIIKKTKKSVKFKTLNSTYLLKF